MSKKIELTIPKETQTGGQVVSAENIGEWAFQNRIPIENVRSQTDLAIALLAQIYCLRRGLPPPYDSNILMSDKNTCVITDG
jgi:hypothetical protein